MSVAAIAGGLSEPVLDPQRAFRIALDALARPGGIARLSTTISPPPPLLPTSASLLLALADYETSIWLDDALSSTPAVGDFLRFHTGAPLVRACRDAEFAVIAVPERIPPLTSFAQGTPEYPDRSTTLIVQVDTLVGAGWQLSGPGILGGTAFRAAPLPADFPSQLAANRARFPCGVDLMFVTRSEIAALPRSTRITEGTD
jgi:alpha-D-ribose 1-methylphosphonate 5-triphosphate synthase subunit PhnH